MGENTTQTFTVTSGGLCGGAPVSTDLTIYAVYLATDPTGTPYLEDSFTPFQPTVQGGTNVPVGDTRTMEVTFTPSSLGAHNAYLYILSNACDGNNEIAIPMQGVGVPSYTIEDIKAFLDDSVEDGTLEGIGPGDSANGRLNALINMLDMAGELISIGDIEGACEQLYAALGKCDGVTPPPDFVTGDAASGLSSRIVGLMDELGCE